MCSARCPTSPPFPQVGWYGPKFGGPRPWLFLSFSRFPEGSSSGGQKSWKSNDAEQKQSMQPQDQRECIETHAKYSSFKELHHIP